MSKLNKVFRTTRLSIWLIVCALILAATSVYAAGNERPLAAVDILGSPDAAVDGRFAVGTTTPGNKALTVAGVIDFVGAGTVHNYFTQGPGNNMQIRSNVDEYNAVGNSSYAQWNMVMGASLDVFSIRRSPAGSTYNEDALFWIEGDTGNVGIAKVDTSNGATIPFTLEARLHVENDSGGAIRGVSSTTSGTAIGVVGIAEGTDAMGVSGYTSATSGLAYGVVGSTYSTDGMGVFGINNATNGVTFGVRGMNLSSLGAGVFGWADSTLGASSGVYGVSDSMGGRGVYGTVTHSTGINYGVYGQSDSPNGIGVYGTTSATTGGTTGVYGISNSTSGNGVYGLNYATSGMANGVYGLTHSSNGFGVYGINTTTDGGGGAVYGSINSSSGTAVLAMNNATSGTAKGVEGITYSTEGYGVRGSAAASTGSTYGVYGASNSSAGTGVYGNVLNASGTTYGVYGAATSTAGYDFYAGGTGTDYGPFTGAHEVLLSDTFPAMVQAGMIVSGTGEAHFRMTDDGDIDISSTLPTVRLADRADDKAVLGVLVSEITLPQDHWYAAAEGERFASVNALGEGRVWVTNLNGDIEAGDAITSSEIPGYGQRQNDDLVHIYTLGKAMETVDWDSVIETVTFNGQEYKVYLLAVVYTSG